ncbi:MAG: hypothetical protein HQ546_06615 [Planctomycetes bacterium]|nr:hypothetical protein [Planctomycetota bacterium]
MLSHVRQTVEDDKRRERAIAFLEQAKDFFQAATAPQIGSKPLLYYYSFMNMAKAFLTVRTSFDLKRCIHGLKDPQENIVKRMTITSQFVKVDDAGGKPVKLYREFIRECGFKLPAKPAPTKVVDLLEQIVGIHRITSHTLKRNRQFFPIKDIVFEHDSKTKQAWIALCVERGEIDNSSSDVKKNTSRFKEVESTDRDCRRYESEPLSYSKSPRQVLIELVQNTRQDIWSELRPGGYRFWFSSIPKARRRAQLASGYEAMFYFGSVSRYRPEDFQKLTASKHGWMIQEFINTQPLQFIYFLGSDLMGAEMVVPELG